MKATEGLGKTWTPSLSLGVSNKLQTFKYSSDLLVVEKKLRLMLIGAHSNLEKG